MRHLAAIVEPNHSTIDPIPVSFRSNVAVGELDIDIDCVDRCSSLRTKRQFHVWLLHCVPISCTMEKKTWIHAVTLMQFICICFVIRLM